MIDFSKVGLCSIFAKQNRGNQILNNALLHLVLEDQKLRLIIIITLN